MIPPAPPLHTIIAAVCAAAHVAYEEILSNSRDQPVTAARRAIVYLARTLPHNQPSFPELAAITRHDATKTATVQDNFRDAKAAMLAKNPTQRQQLARDVIRSAMDVLGGPISCGPVRG